MMNSKDRTALEELEAAVGKAMRRVLEELGGDSRHSRASFFANEIGHDKLIGLLNETRIELYPARNAVTRNVASFVDILFTLGLDEEARTYLDRERVRNQ